MEAFYKQRVALPLFWEKAVIKVTLRRWCFGRSHRPAAPGLHHGAGVTAAGLDLVEAGGYDRAVLAYVDDDGYPMEVATGFRTEGDLLLLDEPAGDVSPTDGIPVDVLFSHIRPVEGYGYDQRRYVSVWGTVRHGDGVLIVARSRAKGWDERDVPFFEYSERSVPQAHRYFRDLGKLQDREVRPKLAGFWLFLRATRLPVPHRHVRPRRPGRGAAASNDAFDLWLALLTLLGAVFIHLGLNVTNDVFDTLSGADAANSTPTPFSGGSRVIHYGLVSMRTMSLMAGAFFLAGGAIGVYLRHPGWEPLIIGAVGMFFAVFTRRRPSSWSIGAWRDCGRHRVRPGDAARGVLRPGAGDHGRGVAVDPGGNPHRPRPLRERDPRPSG